MSLGQPHDLSELDEYIVESVRIVPEAIEEEFVRTPADLAYWNNQYAKAYERFAMAKIVMNRTEARLLLKHRQRLIDEGTGATVGAIAAEVEMDEDMYKARVDHIRAEVEKVRLNGVVDAVRTKRDMLVSIGAHQRAEMQGDPAIRQRVADGRNYPKGREGRERE